MYEEITLEYVTFLEELVHNNRLFKGQWKLAKNVPLLRDNASVHTAAISQGAINNCKLHQRDNPPYSLDLAASNYCLFNYLKKDLQGQHFQDDDEV